MAQPINDNFILNSGKSIDAKYGKTLQGKTVPYASTSEVNTAINVNYRYTGLTVLIDDGTGPAEYWYKAGTTNDDLVAKSAGGSSSVGNGLSTDEGGNVVFGGQLTQDVTLIDTNGKVLSMGSQTGLNSGFVTLTPGGALFGQFNPSTGQTLVSVSDGQVSIANPTRTEMAIATGTTLIASPEIILSALQNSDATKFLTTNSDGKLVLAVASGGGMRIFKNEPEGGWQVGDIWLRGDSLADGRLYAIYQVTSSEDSQGEVDGVPIINLADVDNGTGIGRTFNDGSQAYINVDNSTPVEGGDPLRPSIVLYVNDIGTTQTRAFYFNEDGAFMTQPGQQSVAFLPAIQELSVDPLPGDIVPGFYQCYKNTTTGTLKLWANDGGTLKSIAFT